MSAGPVPSSQRPIPLFARSDLIARRIFYRGVAYWVLKDPVALKYHRLRPEQYCALQLLDGQRNLEQIRDEVSRELRTIHLTLIDVQNLISDLHQKRLVCVDRPGQGAQLVLEHRRNRGKRIRSQFMNLLYLRLPGWDPETTLRRMLPLFRWMFQPPAVALVVGTVVASWILVAVQFDTFRSRLPEFQQFFGWPNLMYMYLTLSVAKIIHEFGHGLSCKYYDAECHEMGVMLLVFSPSLYCDVTDSWMLRNKWQRIVIGGAGMYIEMFLSALALFGWWYTKPGLLNHLLLNAFFITSATTVLFNANPLMRFDGYYMLSDLLEIPNLRQQAEKFLRDWFGWYCLGIEPARDPFRPETGRFWFILYAVSAWLYRWVILFGIALFLYTVLKPYGLQSIGIALAAISIGSVVGSLVFSVYRIVSEPRSEPMSRPKIAVTLTVLVLLAGSALSIPVPWHIEAAFLIQPHDVRHVYAAVPGQLATMRTAPGERVSQGQELAVLENAELEDRHRMLDVEHARQLLEISLNVALENAAMEQLARERLLTIDKQLAETRRQMQHLRIPAPVDGVVVEPPPNPQPTAEAAKDRLAQWSGTPLDPWNQGCFLSAGTHLLSVAPNSDLEAVLFVDQSDRNELEVGRTVELKFGHLPHRTYQGTVGLISDRHVVFAPSALSNKHGGELPTVTDKEGRERLTSAVYQTTVLLAEDPELLKPGMRGQARLFITRSSAARWLWRYLRNLFHFRL